MNCQVMSAIFFTILICYITLYSSNFYFGNISILQNLHGKMPISSNILIQNIYKTDYNPNLPGVLRYGAGVPGSLMPGVKISFFRTDACSRSSCS